MNVYRLAKGNFAKDLTGEGSRLFGGRWNHIGIPCLYSSESRALALLEYSVNIEVNSIPRALSMVTINIPEDKILEVKTPSMPGNWKAAPAPTETKDYGTGILSELKSLIIKIPSAIIEEEFNYLINPLHKDILKVKVIEIVNFIYDLRIKDYGVI
jgi:RES domain-containing protein